MDFGTFCEVFDCLRRWETTFPYFKDRYALLLLEHAARDGASLATLKRGPYRRLLDKPLVRDLVAGRRGGPLHADDLRAYQAPHETRFRVGLASWPRRIDRTTSGWSWQQTTRPGCNLVLQLNFPLKHNHRVRRLLGPRLRALDPGSHPARLDREMTMAWARIDLDLRQREALIEEVQSDWVRDVAGGCKDTSDPDGAQVWQRYVDELLAPHMRAWDEAVLMAAIVYLRDRVGIRDIYFHTYEGGLHMKNMLHDYAKPPRSLYTQLPRRFCFTETPHPPRFLRREKRPRIRRSLAGGRVRWHVLRL